MCNAINFNFGPSYAANLVRLSADALRASNQKKGILALNVAILEQLLDVSCATRVKLRTEAGLAIKRSNRSTHNTEWANYLVQMIPIGKIWAAGVRVEIRRWERAL